MPAGAVLIQQYNNCTQTVIGDCMSEEALFELMSLECRVDSYGDVYYHNALGQIHREHGPAIECSDGSKYWYQNGRIHRLDGPAIVRPDGYRAWWQNGQLHRLDGPAVEYDDGYREWHIDGKELTDAEWLHAVARVRSTYDYPND